MDNSSQLQWINDEFKDISFGDLRLDKRFIQVANGFAQKSEKNIASTFENWKDIKGCYRFIDNKKVDYNKILHPHRLKTLSRIKEHKRVLLIQDTVEFNYGKRPRTKNLDYCSKKRNSDESINGLVCHGLLAVSDDGTPLGVLNQKYIDRKKYRKDMGLSKNQYQRIPISSKESYKWIDFVNENKYLELNEVEIIHIADREADIYELYRDCENWNQNYLIRACHNRSINKGKRREPPKEKLFDLLENSRAQSTITAKVYSRVFA